LGDALDIVEVGGGLSGLQFLLARSGHRVTQVDPGARDDSEWHFSPKEHARLSQVFGAPVNLLPLTLTEANLADASVDVVLCVSVLEHLPPDELQRTAQVVKRILRPTGHVILTVDLFLDLNPFTHQIEGRWGRNIDVRQWLEAAGLELVSGHRKETYGFPEFDARTILQHRQAYLVSAAGSMAQCLVARLKTSQ
jgi:SAM-dependent methyltransferase